MSATVEPSIRTLRRDWSLAVAGGLIGIFGAGAPFAADGADMITSLPIVVGGIALASIAFTAAYLNAKILDEREGNR